MDCKYRTNHVRYHFSTEKKMITHKNTLKVYTQSAPGNWTFSACLEMMSNKATYLLIL